MAKAIKTKQPKLLIKETFRKWDFKLDAEEIKVLFFGLLDKNDKEICIIEQSHFEDGSEECLLLIKVK